MRYVDRKKVAPPQSLSSSIGLVPTERKMAETYYTHPQKKCYPFKQYKGDDVVTALEELFNKKCAYCESRYAATQPLDVEHFRPKGPIEDDAAHSGYWWLAHEWSNLLPSCIFCNRKQKHRIARLGMTLQELARVKKEIAGKKSSFPVRGVRATCATDDHNLEDPLLIDPTEKDPGHHLQYVVSGQLSLVTPQQNNGQEDVYGATTIYTFGLNRQGLVEERTALILRIRKEYAEISEVLELALPNLAADAVAIAKRKLHDVRKLMEAESPYSACAKAEILLQENAIRDRFEALLS